MQRTVKCDGVGCRPDGGPHTHHLTRWGRFWWRTFWFHQTWRDLKVAWRYNIPLVRLSWRVNLMFAMIMLSILVSGLVGLFLIGVRFR